MARVHAENIRAFPDMWENLSAENRDRRRRDQMPTPINVPVEQIKIDDRYQRPHSQVKVDRMARNFDRVAAGAITVNIREGGDIYIIDGQHRWRAAKQAGVDSLMALCFDALPYEDEAREFLKVNRERYVVKSLDRFRAMIEYNDPDAKAIEEAVTKAGFRISLNGYARTSKMIAAVDALQTIYGWGGADAITETLAIVARLWPGEDEALAGIHLKTVYTFIERHRDEINMERFFDRFAEVPLIAIERKSNRHKEADPSLGVSGGRYMAMLEEYNKNLRRRMRPRRWTQLVGERASHAKLSNAQVQLIRKKWKTVSHSQKQIAALADEFGVHPSTISGVVYRETFKNVPDID